MVKTPLLTQMRFCRLVEQPYP